MELISKDLNCEIKAVGSPDERTLEFVGSTADVDRYGDIIEVEGWDLANYLENPLFLWAHKYDQPPLGSAVQVDKTEKGLIFQIKFATKEQNPYADSIYRLYLAGHLRATSVGFRDYEREPIMDQEGRQTGWRYKKQELYELSAVTVPANPQATIMAVQKGVVSPEEAELIFPGALAASQELPAEEVERTKEECEGTPHRLADLTNAKAGAVLSAKNQGALSQALDLIQSVLDAAEGTGTTDADGKGITDYYSRALNPGVEPEGGKPALGLEKIIGQLTQIQNRLK